MKHRSPPGVRTVVTFETTAFNTTAPRDDFMNDGCFGDDVLRAMRDLLRADGVETNAEPGQEDFGWYLRFQAGGREHCLVVGYRPEEMWIGWVERSRGLLGSLLFGRRSGVSPLAAGAIHRVVARLPGASRIQWHHDAWFRSGDETRGAPTPEAP